MHLKPEALLESWCRKPFAPKNKRHVKNNIPEGAEGDGVLLGLLGTSFQILNCGFRLRTAENFSILLVVFSDDRWKEHCVLVWFCAKHHHFLIGPPKGTIPSCFVGWWKNSSYHILWIRSQQINCSEYCNQNKEERKKKTLCLLNLTLKPQWKK